ncbi:MAG: hypothetical protein FJ295_10405 [Planctomycetes bacterium]|nr:hypothetical protein [Planctomycetota bacterium]
MLPELRTTRHRPRTARISSRGVTLIELLAASVITVMIAAGVAMLAATVRNAHEFSQTSSEIVQHGRVCLERIERAMRRAHASEAFPGIISIAAVDGAYLFPDTAVVWDPPGGTPADAAGLPRVGELTVFCPSPSAPNQLLEITLPGDNSTVPSLDDEQGWVALLASFKNGPSATRHELTSLLRVSSSSSGSRGNLRFETRLRPSTEALQGYRNSDVASQTYLNWRQLGWPQDLYSRKTGLRQVWCRIELQLTEDATSADAALFPLLDSVALYYVISR